MSARPQRAPVATPRGDSILPVWLKAAGRVALTPAVQLARALRLSPNAITAIGALVTAVAAGLVAWGALLGGAAVMVAGSLLDAVDGALARATGGSTRFGAFLDSTLDRAGEALVYVGVAVYFLRTSPDPTWPVVASLAALVGSFLVSYSRARAEGIGLDAEVGLAPRTERLVLVIIGLALAGLGWLPGLIGILWLIGALSTATVLQRIWHVRGLAEESGGRDPGEGE